MARHDGEVRERNALAHRDAGCGKVRSLGAIPEASRAARDRETLAWWGATTSNGGNSDSRSRHGGRGETYPGSSGGGALDAVNGEVVGRDLLSNMSWTFEEMISYASRGGWVRPGDVLGSGTCGIGGCLAELWGRRGERVPPPLRPGDTVTLTASGIGSVRNTVVPGVTPVPVPRGAGGRGTGHEPTGRQGRRGHRRGARPGRGRGGAAGRAGAHVIATDVEPPCGMAVPCLEWRRLDVTRLDEWAGLAEWLRSAYGRVDGLVNNAGITWRARVGSVAVGDLDRVMAVNLTGPLLGMQHLAPLMPPGSSIVNVGSAAALTGHCAAAYTASKWALRGLSAAACLELGPRGIRVNCVHPGFIETSMTASAPAGFREVTSRRRRSAAPGRWTRWPRRSRSCCPTTRRSSPAPTCRWTAA
jgi:3alpha(or 20beta)-hydroxysteroid dehydrogenase